MEWLINLITYVSDKIFQFLTYIVWVAVIVGLCFVGYVLFGTNETAVTQKVEQAVQKVEEAKATVQKAL